MSVGGAAWKNGTGNSTAQFRSTGTKLFERFHEMIREFQDGYVSMIHDMESGEGLQGAFAKGRNATKDLKAQIQATRDDIDIAFGNVADIGFLNTPDAVAQAKASEEARSIAIERYNKAAGEYALSLMYTSVQVSDVRKTIDGFRGTAAGLHDVFADLGWTNDLSINIVKALEGGASLRNLGCDLPSTDRVNRRREVDPKFDRAVVEAFGARARWKAAQRKPKLVRPASMPLTFQLTQTNDLYAAANRAVSRSFPPHVRDDIISEIVLSVLAGETQPDEIAAAAKAFANAYLRDQNGYALASIDAVVGKSGSGSFHDLIATA